MIQYWKGLLLYTIDGPKVLQHNGDLHVKIFEISSQEYLLGNKKDCIYFTTGDESCKEVAP